MTTTPDRSTEIASYLAAVERHLNDLPAHIRQDLMSELDTHLSEVAADLEPGAALRDLLGSPEAYARELRDTAEVEKEPVAIRMRRKFSDTAAPALARVKGAADKYAVSTGHADAAELRERLRPGWWVLRGAIVAALFVYWLASAQFGVTGYSIIGSLPGLLLVVAVLLVSVWASMRLGAKSMDWRGRRRRWMIAGGIAIVALAGYQFSWILTGAIPTRYVETQYVDDGSGYGYISDLYVYDENGNPLTGVYLFDQDGNPIYLGDPTLCESTPGNPFATPSEDDYRYEDEGTAMEQNLGYQYPLCASQDAATMPAGEAPTAEEGVATELPSEGPAPTAGETPSELETSPEPAASATPDPEPTK
ncbi:HAAS signaling domain-containing protein [Glycomyces algeriensis]|uniref:Uncharacterized protein n=1 Tax=Glycomyces algeriensis TaxID=256037 RepID=A0A9W6LFU0_9ACTN|nr:hypothetical protein [Glycomyces algeriensis]MDA1365345.1 hypothetical protein [Glycomyces algeriensis]MDR7349591.1 hypothetical protein [Glycomyces algeriensis]GLI42297.1 hypothetical protein GALLR39Z86_21470 [Glycomyces algeriensis]